MSILIVSNSIESSSFLKITLESGGFSDLIITDCIEDAIQRIVSGNGYGPVEMILLDIIAPDTECKPLLKVINQHESCIDIPSVVVTSNQSEQELTHAFELGVFGYITRPFTKTELLVRLRSILNLKYKIDSHKEEAKRLEEVNKKLQKLSLIDCLTGIPNRRHFELAIDSEWKRAQRYSRPLSFILVDIDHFKAYNDHYGHQEGDDCIKEVAKAVIGTTKRPADLVARYGGEEFAIILPDTDLKPAIELAKKARLAVESLKISHGTSKSSDYVTISLGVATVTPRASLPVTKLIKAADSALYMAKEKGRNMVIHSRQFN